MLEIRPAGTDSESSDDESGRRKTERGGLDERHALRLCAQAIDRASTEYHDEHLAWGGIVGDEATVVHFPWGPLAAGWSACSISQRRSEAMARSPRQLEARSQTPAPAGHTARRSAGELAFPDSWRAAISGGKRAELWPGDAFAAPRLDIIGPARTPPCPLRPASESVRMR